MKTSLGRALVATVIAMLAVNLSVAEMPALGDCVNRAVSNAPLTRVLDDDALTASVPRGPKDAVGEIKVEVELIQSEQQWFQLRALDASVSVKGPGYRGGGKVQLLQRQEKVRHTITYRVRVDLRFLAERFTPRLTKEQREELLEFLEKRKAKKFLEAYGEGIVDSVVRGGGVEMLYQFVFSDERSLKQAEAGVSAAVEGLGKGGVNVEEVARNIDKQAELHVHIVQRGGLVDPSVIAAVTSRPGDLEEVVKKIEKSLLAIRWENSPTAGYGVRRWKNISPIIGFHKELEALTDGMDGLGTARTAAVARLADEYLWVAPRKKMAEVLLLSDLPVARRAELKAALKSLTVLISNGNAAEKPENEPNEQM